MGTLVGSPDDERAASYMRLLLVMVEGEKVEEVGVHETRLSRCCKLVSHLISRLRALVFIRLRRHLPRKITLPMMEPYRAYGRRVRGERWKGCFCCCCCSYSVVIRHGVYNHVVCAFPFDFFCAAHRVGGQQQNDCTGWTKEEDDANGFVDVAPSAERNKTHTKKERASEQGNLRPPFDQIIWLEEDFYLDFFDRLTRRRKEKFLFRFCAPPSSSPLIRIFYYMAPLCTLSRLRAETPPPNYLYGGRDWEIRAHEPVLPLEALRLSSDSPGTDLSLIVCLLSLPLHPSVVLVSLQNQNRGHKLSTLSFVPSKSKPLLSKRQCFSSNRLLPAPTLLLLLFK